MLPVSRSGKAPAVRGRPSRAARVTGRLFRACFIIVPAIILVAIAFRSASIAQFVAHWHHKQAGAIVLPATPSIESGGQTRSDKLGADADALDSRPAGAGELTFPRYESEDTSGPSGDSEECVSAATQWIAEEEERARKRQASPQLNMTFFLHVPRTAGRRAPSCPPRPASAAP